MGANRHDPGAGHQPRRSGAIAGAVARASSRSSATSPTLTSLEPLFAGLVGRVDVIHTAGVIHPRRVADFERINAGGTAATARPRAQARRPALRARLVQQPVRHQLRIRATTSATRSRTTRTTATGSRRWTAELAVFDAVEAGLDAVIVRPPWFYGPHQPSRQTTFFKLVRTGRFPVIGGGDQMRSMVYVENLVDGVVRGRARRRRRRVAAGGSPTPAPYAVSEIVETVGRALTRRGLRRQPNRTRLPAIAAASPSSPTR